MTDRLHSGAEEDPVAGRMQKGIEWKKKTWMKNGSKAMEWEIEERMEVFLLLNLSFNRDVWEFICLVGPVSMSTYLTQCLHWAIKGFFGGFKTKVN